MAKKTGSDRVYKRIELVGTSTKSIEGAIENAVKRASETLSGLSWFEVKEIRGAISETGIREYQVVIVINFEVL